jgi:hypothetical protein
VGYGRYCSEASFAGRTARCVHQVLHRHPGQARTPATLDLIGHSTRDHHLLRLGNTPIDMLDRQVARFFRDLADEGLLARLHIGAVRLLGCQTAVTDAGQRTLRLPVFGTLTPLLKSHSNAGGFDPAFSHLLAEAPP